MSEPSDAQSDLLRAEIMGVGSQMDAQYQQLRRELDAVLAAVHDIRRDLQELQPQVAKAGEAFSAGEVLAGGLDKLQAQVNHITDATRRLELDSTLRGTAPHSVAVGTLSGSDVVVAVIVGMLLYNYGPQLLALLVTFVAGLLFSR